MPSKGYSAVPNLKVKRLTRLFESKSTGTRSPRKSAMMPKEQRTTKSSKAASAGATTGKKEQPKSKTAAGAGEAAGMTEQQKQQGDNAGPVVAQPTGAQPGGAQAGGAAAELMKRFLEKGAIDRTSQQKRKGDDQGAGNEQELQRSKRNHAGEEQSAEQAEQGQDQEMEGSQHNGGNAGGSGTLNSILRELLTSFKEGQVEIDQVINGIASLMNSRLEEQLRCVHRSAERAAEKVFASKEENDKCARSVLIFNADKWQMSDTVDDVLGRQPLADRITEVVHTMTRMMVTVQDSFPLGKREVGKDPKIVRLIFGSVRQKNVFFRCIAANMRKGTAIGKAMKMVSIRDCFPKVKIEESKQRAALGWQMKRDGMIASYKVVARGPECIPVLEVKKKDEQGRPARNWEVYNEQEHQETEDRGHHQNVERWMTMGRRGRARLAPPVWSLDMDYVSRLPPEQAGALVTQERERLQREQAAYDREQEDLEWATYEEPY